MLFLKKKPGQLRVKPQGNAKASSQLHGTQYKKVLSSCKKRISGLAYFFLHSIEPLVYQQQRSLTLSIKHENLKFNDRNAANQKCLQLACATLISKQDLLHSNHRMNRTFNGYVNDIFVVEIIARRGQLSVHLGDPAGN